jgi:hypothetical protein
MIVKGHGLRSEGGSCDESGIYLAGNRRSGYGFCACGARSSLLESTAARRRWHDEHKAAIVFSRILHQ